MQTKRIWLAAAELLIAESGWQQGFAGVELAILISIQCCRPVTYAAAAAAQSSSVARVWHGSISSLWIDRIAASDLGYLIMDAA